MRVYNIINNNFRAVPNQFIIEDGNKICFQSYDSMIATVDRDSKTITLGRNWNYSQTTSKHRNTFFSTYVNMSDLSTTKGIQNALKNGLSNGWTITETV